MRATIVVLLSIVAIQGCTNGTAIQNITMEPPNQNAVIVEGTVHYSMGGGTREMSYPPGFVLGNMQWISPTLDSPTPVYVSGIIGSNHVDRRVRVFGTKSTVTKHGTPSSYVYTYTRIVVDSVRIIN